MPHEISISGDRTYIKVRSWSHLTEEELKRSLDEVISLSAKENIHHVLINGLQVESAPNSPQIFQFGDEISKLFSSIRLWFAIISSEKTKGDLKFLETVIHNRTKNAKVFEDEESALVWLKSVK